MADPRWPEDGVRCVLAPNPGPLTGAGTNSYILGAGAVAVIDPGPDDPAHLAALEAALGPAERISHIVVTHAHRDHSPLARVLAARWGASVAAFGDARAGVTPAIAALGDLGGGEGVDDAFAPDLILADGAVLEGAGWRLVAHWTPGHMGNHICLQWGDVVFSGDHVMGWATTVVSPPDGDMAAYMASLDRLAGLGARVFYPGHGAPVADPAARLAELIAHRRAREAQILAALTAAPQDIPALTARVYAGLAPGLVPAAARNVLAHLIDLCGRGLAVAHPAPGPQAGFSRP
ncbi:MAG: MBL fold metallo-hydrolase [Alkalilacustris sp.]